jgi:hypothetical protein
MPLTMEAKLSSRRMIPAASAMDVNPQREPKERKEQKKKIIIFLWKTFGTLRHIGARDAHRHANVRFLECGTGKG